MSSASLFNCLLATAQLYTDGLIAGGGTSIEIHQQTLHNIRKDDNYCIIKITFTLIQLLKNTPCAVNSNITEYNIRRTGQRGRHNLLHFVLVMPARTRKWRKHTLAEEKQESIWRYKEDSAEDNSAIERDKRHAKINLNRSTGC